MRYREDLDRAARTALLMPASPATQVWVTRHVPSCDRERFRDAAVAAARRRHVFVLLSEEDGFTTAEFSRDDRAEAMV